MPRKILRKNIADEMLRDHAYSRGELWMFYSKIMRADHCLANYSKMSEQSFYRLLREWNRHGGLVRIDKKYILASQDAKPCWCQRNVDRFRRAWQCIKSFL